MILPDVTEIWVKSQLVSKDHEIMMLKAEIARLKSTPDNEAIRLLRNLVIGGGDIDFYEARGEARAYLESLKGKVL